MFSYKLALVNKQTLFYKTKLKFVIKSKITNKLYKILMKE